MAAQNVRHLKDYQRSKKSTKSQPKADAQSHGMETLQKTFDEAAKRAAWASGKPYVFLGAVLIIAIWGVTGPLFHFNDTWQLIINTSTTIITFLMVFLIQNTQNRDSEAMQIKLDEIIRAIDSAKNDLMNLEDKSAEEIEAVKGKYAEMAKETSDEQSEPDKEPPVDQ